MTLEVPCPTCGRNVAWNQNQPYRPFCSKRCRLIDLGEWLDENRRIPDDGADDPAEPPLTTTVD